jgi:Flp pilus assembly protein TadB
MIGPLLLGAGFGLGLWALAIWAVPPRLPLGVVLSRLDPTPPPEPILTPTSTGWAVRAGRPAARPLAALGLPGPRLRRDLAILGVSPADHLAAKATVAVTGLLAPAVFTAVIGAAGLRPPLTLPALAGLVLAAGGFVVPDLSVRMEAARRRAGFRHALAAYLNLVRVLLAGGAGVDGALTDAAAVGEGWAFGQLTRALTVARITRTTPWARLGQLGDELDVPELSELAASISLAGTEGAKVRASLAAKASALRVRELTDAEGHAQAATERMSLPVVVLFAAFLVFIGYPALSTVLNGL